MEIFSGLSRSLDANNLPARLNEVKHKRSRKVVTFKDKDYERVKSLKRQAKVYVGLNIRKTLKE